jgi:hypothetical protein
MQARAPSKPSATTTPSRWIMPKAMATRLRAGSRFPNGMGSKRMMASIRHAAASSAFLRTESVEIPWTYYPADANSSKELE